MNRPKRVLASVAIAVLFLGAPAGTAGAAVVDEVVGEALAQAFTLRASADQGGASPLHFYFGSYADAYLTTPPPEADGQASWYNFGIAETALFKPPEDCTPEKNAERVEEGLRFVAGWLVQQIAGGEALDTLVQGNIPAPPAPTLPCGGGRFPGFAQSRYPETSSIGPSAEDDLLGSGACRGDQACIEVVRAATGDFLEGGSFRATATAAPSQSSDATVLGLQVAELLHVKTARSTASTVLGAGGRVTATATWTLSGICFLPSADGCALEVETLRKTATVVRSPDGKVAERDARTVIAGVRGSGAAGEVTAGDLGPGLPPVELGGFQGCVGCVVQLEAVASTGGCGDPASELVADAGGLRLFARGNGEPTLPIPIVGNAAGGGLMLGGACASGRVSPADILGPGAGQPGGEGGSPVPGLVAPPVAGAPVGPPAVVGPLLSPPQIVRREVVRYVLRTAPAWRTAPYWGSALGAMILLIALGVVFRRTRLVAPAARRVDRFARQFVRG